MRKVKKKLQKKTLKHKKSSLNEAFDCFIKKNTNLTDVDVPFIRSFYNNLFKEQDEAETVELPDDVKKSPEEFDTQSTEKAYADSLEPDTNKDAFDVEGLNPDISTESIKKIKEWSSKLDEFAEFLNDPSENSLHRIIADNDKPGSLLRGITRKASDSITRIAGEIEKLKEVLNGFIIMAPKKLRDSEQQ